jgi:hypothetical protein
MESLLLLLKGNYLLVPLIMAVVLGCVALYDKLMQKEYPPETYAMYLLGSGIISFISVYINTLPDPVITEEILKGPPNF